MIEHPRQNRVTPFGAFEATACRGMFLGNRGDLHAPDGGLGQRRWAVKAWICCALSPKRGGRIEFDRKGTYYPLFFLDEVTAFAAGHRPCAQCRYKDYTRFKRFWAEARGINPEKFIPVGEIDGALHHARIGDDREKKTFATTVGDLPDGAMVSFADAPASTHLLWRGRSHCWSQHGYQDGRIVPPDLNVTVLTPAPLVDVLASGYEPIVHPSVPRS